MATNVKNKKVDIAGFVHLHNHSHYSLLDGLQKVPEMLDRVKELGMNAVALTDHGTMSGIIELYKQAREREIKPIIGIEAYVAPRTHKDKVGKEDANPFHLIILAMNNVGYENLMRLSTIAHLEGFYYKPRIDHELLEKYNEGLIVLSGCMNGEVSDALRQGQTAKAEEVIKWYQRIFGDRYYIEVQDHGHKWAEQAKINSQLLELAAKFKIPPVLTADAHYCHPADQEAHEVLLCVQTGSLLSDESRMSLKDMDLFVSDPKEIAKRWADHPEVLSNTVKVAERCEVEIEFGRILIPTFATPEGQSDADYLAALAYQGLAWRYGNIKRVEALKLNIDEATKLVDKAKIDRLKFELSVIKEMGLSSYFLMVADFINWAKDRGIIIGPGRGSAAGSIVSYAMNITDLDPLAYDLLFERFLNPDRISMPDIDIDFQDDRRDEVIQYVIDKYGEDRVANIVTFGTMAARNAIRDTARVLGLPYADADRLAKMIPPPVQGRHTPLSKHVKDVPELKTAYASSQRTKEVIDLAIRLEGTIRSHGVHAAGVVIAPDEIVKFTPLEMAQKGVVATQYSMNPIDDLGLLKIDFLGLSNLTIIKNTLRIIRKVEGKEINISEVPLDDKPTYQLLGRGETTGVFQLESAGMKRYIKKLKPERLEDITAMVSLYRPGPMQWIDDFIDRKQGRKAIEYLHPKMEASLKETYGILVYQEQVMQIAKDLCGFSGGEADTLRKAIGKKIPALLAKMKEQFIAGGVKNSGLSQAVMETFWKQLEDFAAYCFNKSHGACYALIAYWTAYLKAHYPSEFMAALMTSDFQDIDRIAIDVNECRQMGMEVLQPDINESFVEFATVPGQKAIRFALAAIKNVGVGAAEHITEIRKDGKFKSVEDFAHRASLQSVNRKTWESLIKCGAFDSLEDRSTLIANLDLIMAFAAKVQKQASEGQFDLFASGGMEVPQVVSLQLAPSDEEISERERLVWERQLLGLYITRHPLEDYRNYLDEETTAIAELKTSDEGKMVVLAGFVTAVRKILTRNGASMAFVSIEDLTQSIELIVFPKLFESTAELWEIDKVVVVKGKVSTKDRDGHVEEVKILAETAAELDHAHASSYVKTAAAESNRLVLHLPSTQDREKLAQLRQIFSKYPGDKEVVVVLGPDKATQVKLPMRIAINADLQTELAAIFDAEAVSVEA